jgi:Tol biopolymer transport system component
MPRFNFKKIFLIIAFVIVIIFIGYLIYKVFFATPTAEIIQSTDQINQTQAPTGQLPEAQPGTNVIIDDFAQQGTLDVGSDIVAQTETTTTQADRVGLSKTASSVSPTVSTDGSGVQFYNKIDNQFYKLESNGQVTALTDKKFYNVDTITWSPDKNKAIMEYPDKTKIIYDFSTDQQINLPSHWEDFSFSPDGNQIVFKSMGLDTDNRWLAVMNSDGTQAKQVEAIGVNAEQVIPSWSPNNQIVAMMSEGADFNTKNIYFIGLNGENFRMTTTEGRGFEPLWSPQGDKLLYSVYSDTDNYKPRLWTVAAQGDNIGADRMPIDLETWANKCTFVSNDQLYCAVPQTLDEGAGMFPFLSDNTTDDLYKVDLKYGTKTLVSNKIDFPMNNLMVTNNESEIFFTDSYGQLHKISLQ